MEYVLSLSWPGTVCSFKHCTALGKKNYFQVHGLWPNNKVDCRQVPWTQSDLSAKNRADVPLFWNWMYGSEMQFIDHELSKHGSCWDPFAADLDKAPAAIADLLSNSSVSSRKARLNTFLQVPITWSRRNDLFEALRAKGICPQSSPVATAAVVRALEEHFGVGNAVFPICKSRGRGVFFFSEIRFCLDADYRLASCGAAAVQNHIRACSREMLFLPFPSLKPATPRPSEQRR